ncbi:MAG: U32 family peptidase [Clostridia bacterium]|nr:U32 family peptidase [Clostridia bacterium]
MRSGPIELLAPAGDASALRAAVQNGADAVYLGAGAFNARRNAGNFDGAALDEAVAYCHARGVKVHVTLNTLVREDEFEALLDAARAVNRSGADAVIVQDLGVARALRQVAPDIQLHASTQLAAHNRQAVAFLRDQGFDRVVMARELTFDELAACAAEGVEIEAFVHGALCVACSGQCLMSSMVGGRSGNRGLCAQPCRLPWRLDNEAGYLLSTRDLCGIHDLARLRDAGVCSLKIEGRLKRAEYVAVTVAAYRRALDALAEGRAYDPTADIGALRQMFNRGGFTRGYGPGVAEAELMYPERPNHVGVRVGVCRANGRVSLEADVRMPDALALRRAGSADIPVKLAGQAGETAGCPAAKKGDALWRTVSEDQMARARESFDGEYRRVPVTARAVLKVGRPAALEVSDGERVAKATGAVIERATGRGLDAARARAQLDRTGGTPYAMSSIELDADADAFCPASLLNGLRRDALAALERMRTAVDHREGRFDPTDFSLPRRQRRPGEAGTERAVRRDGDAPARCEATDNREQGTAELTPPKSLPLWGRWPEGPDEVDDRQAADNGEQEAAEFTSAKSLPLWGRWPEGPDEVDDRQAADNREQGTAEFTSAKSLPLWGRWPEGPDEVDDRQAADNREQGTAEFTSAKSLPLWGRWPEGPDEVDDRRHRDRPLLLAQSPNLRQLEAALDCGADVAVFAPMDVRAEALAGVDLSALSARGRLMLAVPAVLTAEALDGLNAWALQNAAHFEATFLSNVGQLGLDWPGARIGDYMLNIANNAAAEQLREWGFDAYTPSVELNAGQIARLDGGTDLILWGRIPLMHLRHCPLRAAEGMKGPHAACRHCDGCAPEARLDGRTLVDRKGAAFPLARLAQPGGCVVEVLNSAPLMPLCRLDRLPETAAWRLLLGPGEPTEAIVRVYRAALDGADFKALPEWAAIDAMNTTTGHYFRGVE